MAADPHPEWTRKFQAIREAYRFGLPGKIDRLLACWAAAQRDEGDGENREEVTRLIHSLAGSAGTFGFATIGEHASALEELLMAGHDDPSGGRAHDIERRLAALLALVEPEGIGDTPGR